MTSTSQDISPARVARIAGAMYLIQIATGTFAELFARNPFISRNDSSQTAHNIMQSEQLFRIGIASDLVTYTAVLIATWALFAILKQVNRNLALLALLFRIIELSFHFNATLNSVAVLRLLSGAEALHNVAPIELQTLAQHALWVQGAGLRMGFIPLGLGSAIFAYLFFKSRCVPRVLAGWGMFASLLLAAFSLLIIVYPNAGAMLYVPMLPMGVYEIALGIWLLFRGVKPIPDSSPAVFEQASF